MPSSEGWWPERDAPALCVVLVEEGPRLGEKQISSKTTGEEPAGGGRGWATGREAGARDFGAGGVRSSLRLVGALLWGVQPRASLYMVRCSLLRTRAGPEGRDRVSLSPPGPARKKGLLAGSERRCHTLALCPGTDNTAFPNLSFLIYETGATNNHARISAGISKFSTARSVVFPVPGTQDKLAAF